MTHNQEANELPPPAQLMKFIVGHWISKPIYVAAELGIADLLADGPRNIEYLAQTTQSHAPSLYRVLRALAGVGIFAEIEDREFALTPMAEYLKTGAMRPFAPMFHADWNHKAWGCFLEAVKTGQEAFAMAHGVPLVQWLKTDAGAARVFNEANAIKAARSHRAIIEAYDFSAVNTLTDVGGGLGVLAAEILRLNPHMEGVVFDTPSVVQEAEKTIETRGLAHRLKAVGGDFFRSVPSGSDVYLLSNILHDWNDEKCRMILKNCRGAMRPDSKLLVMEMVVPPGNNPSIAKLLDLEMMVMTGGRERTESEFRDLFRSANLEITELIPAGEELFIIEAIEGGK